MQLQKAANDDKDNYNQQCKKIQPAQWLMSWGTHDRGCCNLDRECGDLGNEAMSCKRKSAMLQPGNCDATIGNRKAPTNELFLLQC